MNLGTIWAELGIRMDKFDRDLGAAQARLQAAEKQFENVAQRGEQLSQTGQGLTMGLTVPIVLAAGAAVKLGSDYEKSMNILRQASGASKQEMKALGDYALEMGSSTVFSARESADAMISLAKAGMTPAQIQGGALAGAMAMAATEGIALDRAADITVSTLGAFGLAAGDATMVADALAGGANASTASVESLAIALSQAGMVSGQMGLSVNDTVGVLSMFSDAGLKGSDAGTSLRTMLMRLVPQSDAAAAMMEELGISFVNADGSIKDITEVAAILEKQMGHLTEEQRISALTTMFGADAIRGASIMIEQGAAGTQKYIDATKERGAAEKLAKAATEGNSGAMEEFGGALETLAILMTEHLLPAITDMIRSFSDLVTRFAKMSPEMRNVVLIALAIAAALGPVLLVTGKIITTTAGIASFFAAWKAGAAAAGVSMKAFAVAKMIVFAKIIAIIAVIAALVAAVAWLVVNWDKLPTLLAGVWEIIKVKVGGAIDSVVGFFSNLPGRVGAFLTHLATVTIPFWIGFGIGTLVRLIATGIANALMFFMNLPGRIATFLAQLPGRIATAAPKLLSAAQSMGRNAVNAVVDFFSGLPGRVWTELLEVRDKVVRIGSRLLSAATTAAGNIWTGFKKGLGINSPSYIERAMTDILVASAQTVNQLGKDFRALDNLSAAPNLAMASTINPVATVGVSRSSAAMAGPLIHVENMQVRSDADIDAISRKLARHLDNARLAGGYR